MSRALVATSSRAPSSIDLLQAVTNSSDCDAFYWEAPDRSTAIAALGMATEIVATGSERFEVGARAVRKALSAVGGDTDDLLAVGGFAFAPHRSPDDHAWPPLRFVIPRQLWIRRGSTTVAVRVGASTESGPTDAPPRASGTNGEARLPVPAAPSAVERRRWRGRVQAVQSLIRSGTAEKIVLSRRVAVPLETAPDLAALLGTARTQRPNCTTFLLRCGDQTLFGSSPECLVAVHGRQVAADALAGSAARSTNARADRASGEALLECPKNQAEHAYVAQAIDAALRPLAARMRRASAPKLKSLPEAHHLHTAITATLREPMHLLDLAGILHPTPAVCGVPKREVLEWLAYEEPHRGWYTGGVGWLTAQGDGELTVALRTALLSGSDLTIWAGAGIVEGSRADYELREIETKMRALTTLLSAKRGVRAA